MSPWARGAFEWTLCSTVGGGTRTPIPSAARPRGWSWPSMAGSRRVNAATVHVLLGYFQLVAELTRLFPQPWPCRCSALVGAPLCCVKPPNKCRYAADARSKMRMGFVGRTHQMAHPFVKFLFLVCRSGISTSALIVAWSPSWTRPCCSISNAQEVPVHYFLFLT